MEIIAVNSKDSGALKAALALVRDVFWEYEAPKYSDEGVWAFDNFIKRDTVKQHMEGGRLVIWAAYVGGKVIGVIAARPPCHISFFFVSGQYHRKGVGRALYGVLTEYFTDIGAAGPLTVSAPPSAVKVYQALGFAAAGPERYEDGLSFTPMSRPLEGAKAQKNGGN